MRQSCNWDQHLLTPSQLVDLDVMAVRTPLVYSYSTLKKEARSLCKWAMWGISPCNILGGNGLQSSWMIACRICLWIRVKLGITREPEPKGYTYIKRFILRSLVHPKSARWTGRLEIWGRAIVAVQCWRLYAVEFLLAQRRSVLTIKAFNWLDVAHPYWIGDSSAVFKIHQIKCSFYKKKNHKTNPQPTLSINT